MIYFSKMMICLSCFRAFGPMITALVLIAK